MTAIAIATLVTGGTAVVSVLLNVAQNKSATSEQKAAFFAGLFGATWALVFLMGSAA